MDDEVIKIIYAKVKTLDLENASKIMGYILFQDFAKRDLVRLAYGPESILHSLIVRVKLHLGLCSSSSSTSSPSPLNPIARPCANPFSQSSPRIANENPSSPGFSNNPCPRTPMSYNNISNTGLFSSGVNGATSSGFIDEHQLNEYLSFLNESSRAEDLVEPRIEFGNSCDAHSHRRSYSASDVCIGSEESGLGAGSVFKPCVYYARGFCKNGSHCKFIHGLGDALELGSPSNLDGYDQDEIIRLKAASQQQKVAANLTGVSSLPFNKNINYLLQQQNDHHRAAASAVLMMGEDFYKFRRCRSERNDFLASIDKSNSASRQIYLTFPAESAFKDEDVSDYFSKFGPVQDVRIPYQQKRMFGFVTFVHPETVRFILSNGNPHFICDSRVLVKPYKEKGKILEKRQQLQQQPQLERGDFSPCLSPSTVDSREPYDLSPGGRMFYNAQEMLLRRKLEKQELQQAIELQGRRLVNLQLPDMNDCLHYHQRSLSVGAHVRLTPRSRAFLPFDSIKQEIPEDFIGNLAATIPLPSAVAENLLQQEGIPTSVNNNGSRKNDEQGTILEDPGITKCMEEALPDSLFASPTKLAATAEAKESTIFHSENNSSLSITSTGCIALHIGSTVGMAGSIDFC